MAGRKVVRTVFVTHPDTSEPLQFNAGDEVPAELVKAISNPLAWDLEPSDKPEPKADAKPDSKPRTAS